MNIGYVRASTEGQNLALQIDALKKAECDIILNKNISGKSTLRPELTKLFNKLRKGDTAIDT